MTLARQKLAELTELTDHNNANTSITSNQSTYVVHKPDGELTKLRRLWWEEGNIHPQANWEEAIFPYVLAEGITLEEYERRTDEFNVCAMHICNGTDANIGSLGARADNSGKKADACFSPSKPPVRLPNGSDGKKELWPNLIVEVAYSKSEQHVLNKFEFSTHDKDENPKSIQLGQCVIQISLDCLYYDTFPRITIPRQLLPDPIVLDFLLIRNEFLRM
ncbi:10873_t:CDS:2 [Diversispora eburnea]|uniref:10873_t:CDS:1 n=1 Tax=Diversispora eburnea TaxID=1213867 RepID=A0A9N9AN94_9GLOM|nr:10873_t:CDS:2 [Diversispora eburnea]